MINSDVSKNKNESNVIYKKNRRVVLCDRRVCYRDKIALVATYLGFSGFSCIWKLHEKRRRK